MHEIGLMQRALDIALEQAAKHGAQRQAGATTSIRTAPPRTPYFCTTTTSTSTYSVGWCLRRNYRFQEVRGEVMMRNARSVYSFDRRSTNASSLLPTAALTSHT